MTVHDSKTSRQSWGYRQTPQERARGYWVATMQKLDNEQKQRNRKLERHEPLKDTAPLQLYGTGGLTTTGIALPAVDHPLSQQPEVLMLVAHMQYAFTDAECIARAGKLPGSKRGGPQDNRDEAARLVEWMNRPDRGNPWESMEAACSVLSQLTGAPWEFERLRAALRQRLSRVVGAGGRRKPKIVSVEGREVEE